MQKWKRMAIALLLGMMILSQSGCAGNQEVYSSELLAEEVKVQVETEETSAAVQEGDLREIPREQRALIYVHICGAVKNPGVYALEEGSRACDAVALAGGFLEGADQAWLNQASLLVDGQQLRIYTEEETAELASVTGGTRADAVGEASDGRINLNTATKEELMTLPGVGEAKAGAIIQYRSEYGPFAAIEEIQNIPGIKSAVFEKLRDRISVSG